ncbi:hypothetical protein Gotri_017756 [Gossypium trilobum]|uniref:Major facilitator superfamily (MFS) profile domain-containing protein n=1 Tax=Gossypium trilobum TaxID=34281 RepID=A0A7J9E7K6_9ROSI|nr:hypothetical protein [Gossypium trilobum]
MSGAMIFIKEDLKISDVQVEILAGILNICALVGSLAAGRTSDYIGRRYTIVLASIIFLIGAVLMGYAPNYAILMTGRCTAGVGVGFALMIAPVYSAEISSPSTRGFLTSLPELCISFGILLAFGILKMPESPRWLVLEGRLKEAKKILLLISNSEEEAESRFLDIKIAAGIDPDCVEEVVKPPNIHHGQGVWKDLFIRPTPAVRRILIAAIGIHFFEHATGIEAVVLYSPRIFHKAGVTSKNKLLLATVGVGLTKTTFILIATVFLDKVGRRRLLLTSTAGLVVSLSGLGFALTMVELNPGERLVWALCLSIIFTYLYVAFFSIGLGPITWVYSSEIFPLRLRAQGASIGVAVNRLMNAIVSMSFISIYKAITIGGAFFMFAGVSLVAWWFFFFLLPETKGKSLEEIEILFTKNPRHENQGLEIQPTTSNSV